MHYESATEGIRVQVRPQYSLADSEPTGRTFVFSYMINMLNEGDSTAQLIFRHWRIHDAAGDDSLVDGEGVVGQQPVLAPGDSHEYKSYCVLRSPVGFMEGYYTFIRSSGAEFRVEVPRFHLNGPLVLPASIQDHDLDEETGGPIH